MTAENNSVNYEEGAVTLRQRKETLDHAAEVQRRLLNVSQIMGLIVSVALIGVIMVGFIALQTFARNQRILRYQTAEIHRLALGLRAETTRSARLACLIEQQTVIQNANFARFARRFGAPWSNPSNTNPIRCDTGADPVFIGTDGPDAMRGTPEVDWMNGESGNDTLRARGSGDTIIGGNGNDELYAGSGADWEYGGPGSDTLRAVYADGAQDHLDGGDGHDKCYARTSDEVSHCETVVRY